MTDEMFPEAAAVAKHVTDENPPTGQIYPPQSAILKTSLHVAK